MRDYDFREYRPASLRLWHWLDALAILGLLGTVLLRKTWLSWRTNSAFIADTLAESGTTITPDLAKEIAVGLRAPMWDWHYVLGFTLAGLLVVRFAIAVVIPAQRPWATTFRALAGLGKVPLGGKPHAIHFTAVKLLYAAFYLVLAFMVGTGVLMYFGDAIGLSEAVSGGLKEAHEVLMWSFVGFVIVHVAGVVVAELRGEEGTVSDMISGGDRY